MTRNQIVANEIIHRHLKAMRRELDTKTNMTNTEVIEVICSRLAYSSYCVPANGRNVITSDGIINYSNGWRMLGADGAYHTVDAPAKWMFIPNLKDGDTK